MPKFSKYFSLGVSQHELDFVDVSNEFDTPVYVDPYAIEIRDDLWAEEASANVRSFFSEILEALRADELDHAANLMSHLREPRETFLGVSKGEPQGRGVGHGQAAQLIRAIAQSKAFASGIISDLSEMALYVEGVDRDKVSDLTTNIIRGHLVDYTQQQCELHGIETERYSGPPLWDKASKNWVSQIVQLPYIKGDPVLLVPKYIVRRKLSLDSQEFYNKQLTDFLVDEHFRANDALVHVIRGRRKVFKTEVREATPKSKSMIADMVVEHPHLLETYKELAKQHGAMVDFGEDGPTVTAVCGALAEIDFSHATLPLHCMICPHRGSRGFDLSDTVAANLGIELPAKSVVAERTVGAPINIRKASKDAGWRLEYLQERVLSGVALIQQLERFE
jgi:hypothetical protein